MVIRISIVWMIIEGSKNDDWSPLHDDYTCFGPEKSPEIVNQLRERCCCFFCATELQICQSLSQSLFKKISVYASMLDGCWRSWIICTAETYHQLTALCWLCWIQSAMVTVCHSLPFGMDRIAMQFRIVRNCQDLVGIGWVHLSPGLRRGPSCQAIDPKYPDDSLYPRLILDLSLRLVGGLNMYWFSTG